MNNAVFITPNDVALPLTVYYDHSCVLCRSEIENIKARDDHEQLIMVDCSPLDFDTRTMPVTRETMMNYIHAMDAKGRWIKGTDVFVACYRIAGLDKVASTFAVVKPLMEKIYPIIVKNRYVISKLGVHKIFNALTHRHLERKAKAALAASQGCKDGVCEIKPHA
jgi:predicted DCC family thiol-disulfide oxidoreductase YuxK